MSDEPDPSSWKVLGAFAIVYLVWGSTYLAIRFAIETIPPFAMAAVRYLIAGGMLFVWARARGAELPDRRQVRDAAVVGFLLLGLGNGGVVWGQQWVPSGLAAVLVATVPLWMVLAEWAAPGGVRPAAGVWGGIAGGLVGVAVLASDRGVGGAGPEALLGAGGVIVASCAWAVGSVYSRRASVPARPRMATALQMLWGGVALSSMAALAGDWSRFDPAAISLRSWLALAYLVVFGAIIAYSAYIWLLRVSTPARASTYAYVNPVVALLLGWGLAGEPLGVRTVTGAGIILGSVLVLNRLGARRARGRQGAG